MTVAFSPFYCPVLINVIADKQVLREWGFVLFLDITALANLEGSGGECHVSIQKFLA